MVVFGAQKIRSNLYKAGRCDLFMSYVGDLPYVDISGAFLDSFRESNLLKLISAEHEAQVTACIG